MIRKRLLVALEVEKTYLLIRKRLLVALEVEKTVCH